MNEDRDTSSGCGSASIADDRLPVLLLAHIPAFFTGSPRGARHAAGAEVDDPGDPSV